MNVQTVSFQSERANLRNWRCSEQILVEPDAGEILVRVDEFALTANNITYGVAGDSIGYWKFFPAEGEWGCIPVWGFGEVVASGCPELAVGERLYGYFPMSTHVKLAPVRIREGGFTDGVAHRSELPAGYNAYTRTAADPGYEQEFEAEIMLYRPLFITSFFLDDFLADNDFFQATEVILTSASSKTSVGLAHLLHRHRADRCRVIGLTSEQNREFVEGLGCYDAVHSYQEIEALPRQPSVMVDMAGSGPVRAAVHGHLQDMLRYSCAVGATHWDAAQIGQGGQDLAGPKPVMFFAPSQIQKRIGEWGRESFEAKFASAWQVFLADASNWIVVDRCQGVEALGRVYDAFIAGSADPARGYVVSLQADD